MKTYWAPHAWLQGGWTAGVLLEAGHDGRWVHITPGIERPPSGAAVLQGPVLPGLVDAHSHAFQRAFAGRAERRDAAHDDFWSWRDGMYRVASRIGPEQLRDVATHLYIELLRGGYTQVCEFHYLQHREDGSRYDDPATLAWALADAAQAAGIGMSLLPVLYERAGFAEAELKPSQRRFAAGADEVVRLAQSVAEARRPQLTAGLAIHSLRAASPAAIQRLRALAGGFDGPIHIHVAEQTREVDEALAAYGARPIAWLAAQGWLDARWQLVHATHAEPAEIDAVAASGAGVVLCPSTEANLGDGLPDLAGWLAAGVPLAIGSDSQVTRSWPEELRLLEYGQRLVHRRRNVAAAPQAGQASTAGRLWSSALGGSAAAAGLPRWGLVAGARADLLVVDTDEPALAGLPVDHLLDGLVFSSPCMPWRDVMVGGHFVVANHRHPGAERAAQRFARSLAELHTPMA